MRIVVTGSSGYLGSEIVRQLKNRSCQIVGIDAVEGPGTDYRVDLRDGLSVREALKGADAVVHTASLLPPHMKQLSKQHFVDTVISITLSLLEASGREGIGRFVFTSTTSVYGFSMIPKDRAVWVTEALTPQPKDIYDITKIAAEQLCLDFNRDTGIPVVCLRACRFFDEPAETMAIHRLYRGADVGDIAAAHVQAAICDVKGAHILNVAGPYPFAENDTTELLNDARSVILRYFPNADRVFAKLGWTLPLKIDRVYCSVAARELLGYKPQSGFLEALDRVTGQL